MRPRLWLLLANSFLIVLAVAAVLVIVEFLPRVVAP